MPAVEDIDSEKHELVTYDCMPCLIPSILIIISEDFLSEVHEETKKQDRIE